MSVCAVSWAFSSVVGSKQGPRLLMSSTTAVPYSSMAVASHVQTSVIDYHTVVIYMCTGYFHLITYNIYI